MSQRTTQERAVFTRELPVLSTLNNGSSANQFILTDQCVLELRLRFAPQASPLQHCENFARGTRATSPTPFSFLLAIFPLPVSCSRMMCLFGGHFLTRATDIVGGTCHPTLLICLLETEPVMKKTLPAAPLAIVASQADDPRTLQK